MIVSMHQPHYFPWIGQINKIGCSDIFIILDNVQFSKGGKMNRQLFLCSNFETKYLTIPFKKKGALEIPFRQLEIAENSDWQGKHKNYIINNYKTFLFFDEIWEQIKFIFEKEYLTVSEAVIDSTKIILKMLDIDTKIVLQSEVSELNSLCNNEMIIDLSKKVEADVYLSGNGAKKYMDTNLYKNANIKVLYQKFEYPDFKKFKDHKHTDISTLDLLFNCGIEKSKQIINYTIQRSNELYKEDSK